MRLLRLMLLLGCSKLPGAVAFSWSQKPLKGSRNSLGANSDHSELPQVPLPNVYAVALTELQELESEPLCHRNAARLLVSNCQLLNGKDEATVLTDSGRLVRDFVDSYAASLAICDLERGSFKIPKTCSKFQESTLGRLPVPSEPTLHVSTLEIDKCLEGLAQSDSSWSTWVSYRHKALRFCEAAQAELEKDQNIRLYQRLTKILSHLTVEVEKHMEARLSELDKTFEQMKTNINELEPRLDGIRDGLTHVEELVSTSLFNAAETSREVMGRASAEAQNFKDFLRSMTEEAMHSSDALAAYYETAMEAVTRRVSREAETVMTTLEAAVASSVALKQELEESQLRAEEVGRRQGRIEEGMNLMEIYANAMTSGYEEHGERLKQAQRRADQILGTLDSAATSAASIQSSFSNSFGFHGWWPYIYCPLASLVMGSYGLPPSVTRNVMLLSIGEIAGLVVSTIGNQITAYIHSWGQSESAGFGVANISSIHDFALYAGELIDEEDLGGRKYFRAF